MADQPAAHQIRNAGFNREVNHHGHAADHKDARYIYLRSRPYAGYTVFTLSNSYEGSRTDASGRFLTTKKDVNNHGYGLSNVRAAVEKHGGILHVHANQEKQEFQLSIMLPTAPYAKTTASDSP
ncbi:MAG: GHKL domain-containing protein [Candidatus Ventricola sp.]